MTMGQYSNTMTAWVVVLAEPNEDDELVELVEVDASRIPASIRSRSQYDWFMSDHWENNAEECFWLKEDRPEPGEYLIEFHIDGGWPSNPEYGPEYDEEIVVESIKKVDLGAIPNVMLLKIAGSTEKGTGPC